MRDECSTGKEFEGSGCGLIEILCRHLPGGIEEYLDQLQLG
jgi:hypothetical protein